MSIFYQPGISDGIHHLDDEESRHCVKVLRKRSGDEIELLDGKGGKFRAVIKDSNAKKCTFEIVESVQISHKSFRIHIAIAPTKNIDRIEWFVEKATEVGIDEVTFLKCSNSERSVIKIDRIVKKAVSAMKQSQNPFLPRINDLKGIRSFLQEMALDNIQKYICHVDNTNPIQLKDLIRTKDSYCILIGPEGDFTEDELRSAFDTGFHKVSLGPSRLRTETAGLVACHILNFVNQ